MFNRFLQITVVSLFTARRLEPDKEVVYRPDQDQNHSLQDQDGNRCWQNTDQDQSDMVSDWSGNITGWPQTK